MISKPTLGVGYPEIELTSESTGRWTARAGNIGLKDSKKFYDRWVAYCAPQIVKSIETIKLFRYTYAFGYWRAHQDIKVDAATYAKKTYTALEMQNAYREGISRGIELTRTVFNSATMTINETVAVMDEEFNKRRKNESKLIADADILAANDPTKCNCVICRYRESTTTPTSDEMHATGHATDL